MAGILGRMKPLISSVHMNAVSRRTFYDLAKQPEAKSRIYEYRAYILWPDRVGEFVGLCSDWIPKVRMKHSKPQGVWLCDVGAMNKIVHVWEYDSLEHRAKVRKALADDEDWKDGFIKKAFPCISYQDNALLRMEECQPPKPITAGPYYYAMLTGTTKVLVKEEPGIQMIASFTTAIGQQNKAYAFVQLDSPDLLPKMAIEWANSYDESVLLTPAPWSPIQ